MSLETLTSVLEAPHQLEQAIEGQRKGIAAICEDRTIHSSPQMLGTNESRDEGPVPSAKSRGSRNREEIEFSEGEPSSLLHSALEQGYRHWCIPNQWEVFLISGSLRLDKV